MIFGKDKQRLADLQNTVSELTEKLGTVKTDAVKIVERKFNMAEVDRLTADWNSFVSTFNRDVRIGGSTLIARARELYQNDPHAKKITRNFVRGIIGSNGFVLRNKAGEWKQIGNEWKFELDTLANSKINEAWYQYGINKHICIEGDQTSRAYSATNLQTAFVDGEVFIRMLKGKSYNDYGFTTQVITAERVDWKLNKDLPNGNYIVMGIEVTKQYKKVAVWVRKGDPKSEVDYGYNWSAEYDRIPIEQIIHLFKKETVHQLRGITQLAPVGIRLKMLYGIEEAALVRLRASANVPWVYEEIPNQMGGSGSLASVGQAKDASGNQVMDSDTGGILTAPKGYQVKSLESDFPSATYDPFKKGILHSIAAGTEQEYAAVSGDWNGYNYSVSRAANEDPRDVHKENQTWFSEQCENILFANWLEMALMSDMLKLPIIKFDKFNRPYFFGRRWQYANPTDEMNSNILGLQSFQKTFESILADQGLDLEEQLDQIASEQKLFKSKGLEALYTLLMTKYSGIQSNQQSNNNNNSSNGNGNGKAKHLLTEFM
ncbi:MAG: phage portal protein [Chitinophagaceae bacterium]|nr:phage portal protein [Chitinophagaceae bacterium]